MGVAILISAADNRAAEIRASLSDAGVETYRQYSSTSALLAALPTVQSEIDLVVIDQDLEPMNAWDLTREITSRFPALATTVVINSPTPDDYARAMDSNARSVISYPLQFEDVNQKVHSALQWTKTVRSAVQERQNDSGSSTLKGRMVTLSGSKGGTGVTTLATHLAIQAKAASPEKSVVLVDLDSQKPDVSIVLNVPQYRTISDLLGVIDELTSRQLEDVLYTAPQGYSVLFGPLNGEESELVSETAAKRILGMLRSRFDLVIVDTGSTMSESNSVAIEMADDAYIVATSDVLSLRGAKRMSQLWKRLGIRPTENSRVILNKVDKKQDLQPEASRKIVGLPVVDQYVPESIRTIELAMNRRDPSLVLGAWSSRIARLGVEMGIVEQQLLTVPDKPKKTRASRRSRKSEKGSSAIEFVGVSILIGMIALIGFQTILVGMTWIFATGAANEGARAAAVGKSATAAATSHTPGAWRNGMSVNEGMDTVHVKMDAPTIAKFSKDFAFSINTSAGIVREE